MGFYGDRVTGALSTGATSNTWFAGVSTEGVVGIEPEHLRGVVVPDGHDEDHTLRHCLAHVGQTAMLAKAVSVAKD